MASFRSVAMGLLVSLLVGAVGSSVALAKRPGSDDPPPEPGPVPVGYEIHWIENGSNWTRARDVNVSGFVVGYSSVPGVPGAFVYLTFVDGGKYFVLQDLVEISGHELDGAVLQYADCISNSGWIVGDGYKEVGDEFHRRAYRAKLSLSEGVPMIDEFEFLPPDEWKYPTQRANDVNEDGTVVGRVVDEYGERHGFVWTPTSEPPVRLLDGLLPYGIDNAGGTVVGKTTVVKANAYKEIFRCHNLELPPEDVWSVDPNVWARIDVVTHDDESQTICASLWYRGSGVYPCRYENDLTGWEKLPGCAEGIVGDINTTGQICGSLWGDKRTGRDTVFVFDPTYLYWSLDDLVVGEGLPRWHNSDRQSVVSSNLGMSDAYHSTGYGMLTGARDVDGVLTSFVLIPVEPQ